MPSAASVRIDLFITTLSFTAQATPLNVLPTAFPAFAIKGTDARFQHVNSQFPQPVYRYSFL